MKKACKQIIGILFLALLPAVLTGCLRTTADDLYSLPQASEEYLELQKQINAVLASGAEYSPPISGPNRQSVQLKDIDGDGTNEAVAFFRTTGDKPLKIHIMKQVGSTYETTNIIDGDGTAIESVRYADMDGDGMSELVVGWKMSATLLHMNIYDVRGGGAAVLAESDYSKLFLSDLTGDGRSEVIALRLSSSDLPGEAILFSLGKDKEVITGTASLSSGLESVKRIIRGRLSDGTPAVLVEGSISGTGVVTDIFYWQTTSIVNVSIRPSSGVSEDTVRTYEIFSTDINSDGIIEVPSPRPFETGSDYYAIDWYSYDRYGNKSMVFSTYHNSKESWYMVLPDDWKNTVVVRREDNYSGERTIVFSYKDESGDAVTDFLKVHTLTGDNKEDRAGIGDRFILLSQGNVIYAAEILTEDVPVSISKNVVVDNFRLIPKEWSTGVY